MNYRIVLNWIDINYPHYPIYKRYDKKVLIKASEITELAIIINNLKWTVSNNIRANFAFQVVKFWVEDKVIEAKKKLETIKVQKPHNQMYLNWLENPTNFLAVRENTIQQMQLITQIEV